MSAAIQNPLGRFATYNNLWTMYTTKSENFNSGAYRDIMENVVLSSAGRYDELRVPTLYGRPEFFINNVEIEAMVAPTGESGNTEQNKMTFDVFEPYSMGLFLQSCQSAATAAGYPTYLDDCPYVLKLEIQGQTTYSEFETLGPWFFCVKLKSVSFTTNESGSTYSVEAFPYGDAAFNSTVNTLQSDMKLVGESAYEVLVGNPDNSVITQLNLREQQLVKDGNKKLQDFYSIEFVKPDWGGENPFEDAAGPGNFDFQPDTKGGTEQFKRAQEVYENDKVLKEKVIIDPKKKTLNFSNTTSITNMIDAIILMTRHARETGAGIIKPDSEGNHVWWRLDVDIKLLALDDRRNEYAKVYNFRIVPYKLHSSVFQSAGSSAQGISELSNQVVKRYFYLYTGLNTEVIKWDIQIENLFFTATSGNSAESTGVQANPGANNSVAGEIQTAKAPAGKTAETSPEGTAAKTAPTNRAGKNPHAGGAGVKDTIQRIADNFYTAALNRTSDTINLELEIQGDPYWIPESGQPNFHSSGGGKMVNENGTMNQENRDIMIEIIFRTPYDTEGGSGLYKFMYAGQASPFSGIYKVNNVVCSWKDNHFTQTLKGFRIPGQNTENAKDPHPMVLDVLKPEPSYLGAE
jgi:hypothetical protein